MNTPAEEVYRIYADALGAHLSGGGEEALHKAYAVGRVALTLQLGVIDLVLVHHRALLDFVEGRPRTDNPLALIGQASNFLSECLSPFEMMLRGYEGTNARLIASNADLMQANAALAAAHEALKTEVAEREKAEAALVHSQKLQAVGLLAGGVAHHFNNLLTVVLGNLQLATLHLRNGEDIERYLAPAASAAGRGAELVRQLLTFSRQQILETRAVDVAPLLTRTTPLLASALRGDISVELTVAPDLPVIRIDPDQLELALLNLAVNARDAMPSGGALRISAESRHIRDDRLGLDGDYVVVAVADTGEGIQAELVPRVFEPFFTTKTMGPGAGLGLSQVHGFVHQSGGAVDLESVVGKGTTFRLYLPTTLEPVAEAGVEPVADPAPKGSGRVLVVDDDVEVASLAGELLTSCGYQVRLAHQAKAALELLGAGEPVDLLFSDIIMPGGMNGVQLAEEVRRRFPALPILLATGYSEAIPDAVAGALPVITKPYDADRLCERVGELMQGAKG